MLSDIAVKKNITDTPLGPALVQVINSTDITKAINFNLHISQLGPKVFRYIKTCIEVGRCIIQLWPVGVTGIVPTWKAG